MNVIGSRIPGSLEPVVPKPPVQVVQPNAPALQPQSQGDRVAADLSHAAELDRGLCETTQVGQYTRDCDTKRVDTPSTTSPLKVSLTAKYRKDKLTPESRQTRTKPTFTEMDTIPEATFPANGEGEGYGASNSASPSKTTMVEDNDDLGFYDPMPMDISSLGTEVRTSTFPGDVASQPTGAPQPQLSKRSNPHSDTNGSSKRKRLSFLPSKGPLFTPNVHQTTDNLETKVEHSKKAGKSGANHRLSNNRLSQLLHYKQQTQKDPEEGLVIINSSRPQSYPLGNPRRRSLVLSVKTIIEAFESLHMAANSATFS